MTPTCCLLLLASLAGFETGTAHETTEITPTNTSCTDLGWFVPKVGDIVLFQSPGVFKNIVYTIGCSPGTTHSAIVVNRPDGSIAFLEAPGTDYPVMLSDISTRMRSYKGRVWVRRRCKTLTPEQCRCLTKFACSQEGKPFATFGVFIPPFGHPVRKEGKEQCLDPEALDRPKWFCSELVVAAGVAAGLLDATAVRPRFTDPHDLKSDRLLDLSCGWEKPVRWHRCGERLECWWSRSCAGVVESWSH